MLVGNYKFRKFDITNEAEQEANVFARDLLAPACVLHELHLSSAKEISRVCNISMQSATIRAERMKELEKRNAFYLHPLEREVRKQFEKFISEWPS